MLVLRSLRPLLLQKLRAEPKAGHWRVTKRKTGSLDWPIEGVGGPMFRYSASDVLSVTVIDGIQSRARESSNKLQQEGLSRRFTLI